MSKTENDNSEKMNMKELYESLWHFQNAFPQKEASKKYTPQSEASSEEKQKRASELRTQGRKGCKAKRINFAFTPENYEFIRIMSKATGNGMTKFTNEIIEQYRNDHKDQYETIKAIAHIMEGEQ